MAKDDDFKLLKIQTFILKVSLHCDGCRMKVKKLLQRTEGVYSVSIDVENQRVTVSGNVDSSTLIKKLAKSGKHAELLSFQKTNNQSQPKPNQKQQQQQQQQKPPNPVKANNNKNTNNNNKGQQGKQGFIQGLNAFKTQHSNPPSFSSDEEDFYDDDDSDDDEELRLINEKMNQINLLRQANNAAAANAKKNGANGSNGGNKKGGPNPNQTQLHKNSNGSDQKAPKMANATNLVANNNPNHINGLMGLRPNGMAGGINFGFPPNGNNPHHQPPPMMGAHPPPPPSMMMNMRAHNSTNNMMAMHDNRYMQPQMMYHRSPQVSPYTGYYYQHYPSPNMNISSSDYGTHLFSDENANACVVM